MRATCKKRGIAREISPQCARAIERIIRTFGISKNECLYVGDSPTDVLTGKAAGVRTVAVTTGVTTVEQLRENKPDIIINDLEQLLTYIG